MKIKVKTIDGRDAEFDLPEGTLLERLRNEITAALNIPEDRMRLIFQGKHLDNVNQTLESYGIRDGFVVHLVERPPNVEPLPADPGDEEGPDYGPMPLGNALRDQLGEMMFGIHNHQHQREMQAQGGVIHTNVPIMSSPFLEDRSLVEAIIRRALSRMTYIPDELRNGIEVNWRDNQLAIQLPRLENPHVASPAMERVHLIEGALQNIEHFRTIVEEDGGLVSVVDSLLEGGSPDDATLRQQAVDFAVRLEDAPLSSRRRGAGEVPNSPGMTEIESDARFEVIPARGNRLPYVMRHVLASDLVDISNRVDEMGARLAPHLERYRRILSANMVFNIDNHQDLSTDGRANLLVVYMEHLQRNIHRLSHAVHVMSDLNVHLEDPVPRRLFPQYGNFELAPHVEGELTLELIEPTPSRPSTAFNQITADTIFTNPSSFNDVVLHPNAPSLMTLYPTGIVQQVATMSIPVTATADMGAAMGMMGQAAGGNMGTLGGRGAHVAMAGGRPRMATPQSPRPPPGLVQPPMPMSPAAGGTAASQLPARTTVSAASTDSSSAPPGRNRIHLLSSEELRRVAETIRPLLTSNRNPELPARERAQNVYEDIFGQLVDTALFEQMRSNANSNQPISVPSPQSLMQAISNSFQSFITPNNANAGSSSQQAQSQTSTQPASPSGPSGPGPANNQTTNAEVRNAHAQYLLGQALPMHMQLGGVGGRFGATGNASPTQGAPAPQAPSTPGPLGSPAGRFPVDSVHRHHHAPLHTHHHHHHHVHHNQMAQPQLAAMQQHHHHHHSPSPPSAAPHHHHLPRIAETERRSRSVPREVNARMMEQMMAASGETSTNAQSLNEARSFVDRLRGHMDATENNLTRAENTMRSAQNRMRNLAAMRRQMTGNGPPSGQQGAGPLPRRPHGVLMGTAMQIRQGGAMGNERPSTTINEEVIPIDPFLQCTSRFTRPLRGALAMANGAHQSHYQQVIGDRVPPRSRQRPVPEEYRNLELSVNSHGDLVLSDEESQLTSIVQLAIRSLIATMRESDAERTARASGPVNSVLQNLGLGMQNQAMMNIGMGIGIPATATIEIQEDFDDEQGVQEGDGHMEEDLEMPMSLLDNIAPFIAESDQDPPRARQSSRPAAPFVSLRPPVVTPAATTSPQAKKRKTDAAESTRSSDRPSTSGATVQTSSSSSLPTNWLSIVNADVARQRDLPSVPNPSLSEGYLIGLPAQARTASQGGSSPVGGVAETMDHLTVDSGGSNPQTPPQMVDDDNLD